MTTVEAAAYLWCPWAAAVRQLVHRGELQPSGRKDTRELLIHRSVTLGEVVETTKTKRKLRIPLPEDLVDILQAHADTLNGRQGQSDLLFPSETGGYRTGSVLDKPIRQSL